MQESLLRHNDPKRGMHPLLCKGKEEKNSLLLLPCICMREGDQVDGSFIGLTFRFGYGLFSFCLPCNAYVRMLVLAK